MLAKQFYNQLQAEVLFNILDLNEVDYKILSRYYKKLKNNRKNFRFYRYNWMRRISPMQEVVTNMTSNGKGKMWHLLDAGCGVGTESFFFHSLCENLHVTGTDLSRERLQTALARKTVYEKRLSRAFNIDFLEKNIFEILPQKSFDLVWVMEAISHIDPAEDFIETVYKNLPEHGKLVISDSHQLNPYMIWRIYKMRRTGSQLRTEKITASGEVVSYANERLFSVWGLAKILKNVGFTHVDSQLSIFFPPKLAQHARLFRILYKFDTQVNYLPGFRHLGGIYTIVATK